MIDDIDYLKENSVTDSIPFYIDSATRDVRYYPTPSEYSITFEQPFRFVYGFDVLDAAIPTTQYNIESYNNMIALTLFGVRPIDDIHIANEYIDDIIWSKDFIELFESEKETSGYIISMETKDKYNIDALSNSITNTTHFVFVKNVIENVPISIRKNQIGDRIFLFSFDSTEYFIPKENNSHIIDIINKKSYKLNYSLNNSTIIYYEYLKIDEALDIMFWSSKEYIARIQNLRRYLTPGNFDISILRNELNQLLEQDEVNVETTSSLETRQGRYRFISVSNILIINGRLSTLATSIGMGIPPTQSTSSYRKLKIGDNPLVYLSAYDPNFEYYKVEPPGLINLFGERFLILKIKEIEDHLLGSYGYMSFSPGIGMFKLASSFNDVTNLRFDYVSLVRKPFHPIGKVSKLTLRFETSKGLLYDFKGVNHQLLMVIKFLVPTAKVQFTRSVLNPEYDPNFMKYISENRTIQNKEGSDSDDDNEEENMNNYKKEINNYRGMTPYEEDDNLLTEGSDDTEGTYGYTTDNDSDYDQNIDITTLVNKRMGNRVF